MDIATHSPGSSAPPAAQSGEFHLLINGLSIGSGGGYTVGLQLFLNIARLRPAWRVTLVLIKDHPLHREIHDERLLPNCRILWTAIDPYSFPIRDQYERHELVAWVNREKVSYVLQLNGMIVKGMEVPTLTHCQDPWPYRPEAWASLKDPLVAYFKRRANRIAFRHAAIVGWTSHYLKDLMTKHLGFVPRRGEVFYNGIQQEWLDRVNQPFPAWDTRPMEIATVGNVNPYKQQDMVIRAMPALRKLPGLGELAYRIVGECPSDLKSRLRTLADSLGIGSSVIIEGRASRERIAEVYTRARCFVLMSKCESFGLPAVEAMTFGTPVVIADCCALPEVCGQAAGRVGPDDSATLISTIGAILTSPDKAEALRRTGAANVCRFGWHDTSLKMIAAMEASLD